MPMTPIMATSGSDYNFITAKAARSTGSSAMLGNPSGLPDTMWDMIVDALDTEFNPQLLHS